MLIYPPDAQVDIPAPAKIEQLAGPPRRQVDVL
jgi:hypothetical protein